MKNKFLSALWFTGLFFLVTSLHAQTYEWAQAIDDSDPASFYLGDGFNPDEAFSVTSEVLDGQELSWVVGMVSSTVDIDGIIIERGAYIAMFDAFGNCLDAKNLQITLGDYLPEESAALDIASIKDTACITYNSTDGSIESTLDGVNLYVSGKANIDGTPSLFVTRFIVYHIGSELVFEQGKINCDTTPYEVEFVPSYIAESSGDCTAQSIAATEELVAITGYFLETLTLYGQPAYNGFISTEYDDVVGGNEGYILTLTTEDLNRRKYMQFKTDEASAGMGIDIAEVIVNQSDTVVKIAVTGQYEGNISFPKGKKGSVSLSSTIGEDIFTICVIYPELLALPLSCDWAASATGNLDPAGGGLYNNESGRGVVFSSNKNHIYVTGFTIGTECTFDAVTYAGSLDGSNSDAFLAKYRTENGDLVWVNNLENYYGFDLDVSGDNIYVTGAQFFAKVEDLGASPDIIVNTNLNYDTVTYPGSYGEGNGICVNTTDAIYLCGTLDGHIAFGPPVITLTPSGWGGFTSKIYDDDVLRMANTSSMEVPKSNYTIYPTPFSHTITLSGIDMELLDSNSSLLIHDVNGQLVYSSFLTNTTIKLNLPAGLYHCSVMKNNQAVFTQLLICQP